MNPCFPSSFFLCFPSSSLQIPFFSPHRCWSEGAILFPSFFSFNLPPLKTKRFPLLFPFFLSSFESLSLRRPPFCFFSFPPHEVGVEVAFFLSPSFPLLFFLQNTNERRFLSSLFSDRAKMEETMVVPDFLFPPRNSNLDAVNIFSPFSSWPNEKSSHTELLSFLSFLHYLP